ncbi:unnamed protein product [marine sediment metagenome]|uniref:Uncharacterized protein n=1 Tax=marine sediment metagenome TaxID=412755 RepID=X1A7Y9_9ZZZZ
MSVKLVIIGVGHGSVKVKMVEIKIKELQDDIEHGVQDEWMSTDKYGINFNETPASPYKQTMVRRRDANMIFVTDESNLTIPQSRPGPRIIGRPN